MNPEQRRAFLRKAILAAAATQLPRWAWSNAPALQSNPFALGVASGDPAPDGVVLWTRLVLANPALMQAAHTVRWEVAHDVRFAQIVQKGEATALPALGHSVHVELQGLAPGRWYHYRFMLGDAVSTVGRTRTAPAAGDMPDALRIAFASCQRWEHGHYAAWRHLCADAPDLVLFLGDYIYEYATPKNTADLARTHSLRLATTLADYRDRYALHKSDPALQAAHAACPWSVTWDDHEVQNDYASGTGKGDDGSFLTLRGAAWQAFYENMPLRTASLNGPASGTRWDALQVYRRLRWGRLAHIHLLDSRQYRTWQACRTPQSTSAGAVRAADCADLASPARTLLGATQEQWLDTGLAADAHTKDTTHWSVLAQQTLFSPRHYPSGITPTDSWDGYPAARARLLKLGKRLVVVEVSIADGAMKAFIRKADLARDRGDQRPERFAVGDKVDALVTAFDKAGRKVSLSIKAMEIKDEKEAVEQYGSADSGASLGDILGAALKQAKKED